jgi:esterase
MIDPNPPPTPTAVDRTITLRGLRLHYLDWGNPEAPPLLLLHGGSAHAHWWDWFAAAAADRFHVLALDLRGHGDSQWAQPPAYDIDDYASDVVAFIEALGLHPLRLIGHSLGGMVAAATAARIAEQMAALVIVDSRTRARQDPRRFMERLAQMRHPRYRSLEQGIALYRLLPGDSTAPAEILAALAAHALRQSDDGTWTFKFDRAALAAIKGHDFTPDLAQLRCPILAVHGAASPLMPAAAIEALRAAAPQLEAIEIAGAHHHVMLDRPAEFSAAVGEFLKRT